MSFNEKLIMEKELNIAAILKDKPQGTKLYDWLHNIDVELDTISTTDTETVVWCTNETNNNTTCHRGYSEFGTERGYPDGLQILFPSKQMRDWSKFAWKKGDVLESDNKLKRCIFKEWANDDYTEFNCFAMDEGWNDYFSKINNSTSKYHKADDYVTELHIKRVEKKFGGKLNLETLEIEQPKQEFKDGDIVCISGMGYLAYGIVKSIDNSSKKLEYYVLNDMSTLKFEDWLSFEDKHIQPITETQQIILFDALAKKNKAWDAEKKQIENLKPKIELKPFDKVLSRRCSEDYWVLNFYSHKTDYYHICIDGSSNLYCIPYNEETAHLLGTTNEWKGGKA